MDKIRKNKEVPAISPQHEEVGLKHIQSKLDVINAQLEELNKKRSWL